MNSIQQLVENVMYQMTEIASRNRADGIKGMDREIQAVISEASLLSLTKARSCARLPVVMFEKAPRAFFKCADTRVGG